MYKSIHRWIPSWYYWWKQQWLVISLVIQFVGRPPHDRVNVTYAIDYCLFFQFCHLETQKRRRRKRRKLKKNQIVTDDVIMTSCDQPFYHVFILLFNRLVRMLKEERERGGECAGCIQSHLCQLFVKDNLLYVTSSK